MNVSSDYFLDSNVSSIISGLIARYIPKAIRVEEGRNRIVFIFKNYVVKLPKSHFGIGDNDWEGSISSGNNLEDEQYARTRLVYYNDVPIVFMERVEEVSPERYFELLQNFPWVGSIDCGQVGYNNRGKLVAFDYGRF
jgi:hypothetical protein